MLSSKGLIYVLFFCTVFIGVARGSTSVQLWTVDSMSRIAPQEPSRITSSIRIEAAKNEWEPFQVIVTGPNAQIFGGSPSLSPLRNGTDLLDLKVEVYLQHFVEITESSEKAPLPLGLYPDALIPVSSVPYFEEASTDSTLNHRAFWIDLHIPAEAKAGTYTGQLSFPVGNSELSLPVTLEVWDFQLPNAPTLQSCFGLDHQRLVEIYGFDRYTAPFNKIARSFEELLARHYLSSEGYLGAIDPDTTSPSISLEAPKSPWLGSPREVAETFLNRYQLSTYSIPFWPDWPFSDPLVNNRKEAQQYLANYVGLFADNGWHQSLIAHCGYIDEPHTAEEYAQARAWGQFYNELEKVHGVKLPMLLTEQPATDNDEFGELHGSVDIWSVHVNDIWNDVHGAGNNQIRSRLVAGDQIWLYTSLVCLSEDWNQKNGRPSKLNGGQPPAWLTDFPPLNYRIWSWVAHQYGISGLLYWATIDSRPENDPWINAATFGDETDVYNGDGFLIYPAMREKLGFDGPVASIRLKWIREAMEDHAYLTLLRGKEGNEVANKLSQRIARNIGDWDNDTTTLFALRRDIAELLTSE